MIPLPPPARKVVIAANTAWNIVNFRSALIEGLHADGWRVVALAADDGSAAALAELGAEFEPIQVDSGGTSIIRDGRLFLDYWRILRRLKPRAFLGLLGDHHPRAASCACGREAAAVACLWRRLAVRVHRSGPSWPPYVATPGNAQCDRFAVAR
jgi:hypothetical protein